MSTVDVNNQTDSTHNMQEKMGVFSRLLRLSPLTSKNEFPDGKNGKEQEPPVTYYGVYIPCESKIGPDEETLHVYEDRADALKVVKKYKKARFKSFTNHKKAVEFALQGPESAQERDVHLNNGITSAETNGSSPLSNNLVGFEKPSLFKGPKPQELVQFRKTIENGNYEMVKKTAWENPRYLVSSGDTPSILQEGSRYNALHVAVRALKVEMCDFILSTVSDPHFVELLYGDDNIESCKERATILLDLYLNTPDKSINETPLHFAVKFGAKDIVDLLVSYPQCNRTQTNKFGEQAKDIICQRTKGDANLINEISCMLQDRFYVPVLHSEDDSVQPTIGQPFSPGSPPSFSGNPVSPRLEIRAYAGPMNKTEAHTFRRKWKTPPRSLKTPLAAAKFRLQDVEKGLEKVGRDLAQELKIGWKEYWPFLDTFTDLTSAEGLGLLEDYLKNEFIAPWNTSSNDLYPDSLQLSPKTPTETKSILKNVDLVNRSLKIPKNFDPGLSPMSGLCVAFQTLTMKTPTGDRQLISTENHEHYYAEAETIIKPFLNPGLSPYLCIEKSCQVFAKRLDGILADNEFYNNYLKIEIKHLQQTIASYMDDARFHTVNFHLVHSRVAQIAAQKLIFDNDYNDVDILKASLMELSIMDNKNLDAFSSDEEENVIPTRQYVKKDRKASIDINTQIKCLAKNILQWISDENIPYSKTFKTEEECIEAWSVLSECNCTWQTEVFFRNCRKSASLKRNQNKSRDVSDNLSSSPKFSMDPVSKKLIFENEYDLDGKFMSSSPKSDKNHNFSENDPSNTNDILDINDPNFNASEEENYKDLISDDDSYIDSDDGIFVTPATSLVVSDESDYEDACDSASSRLDVKVIDAFIHGTRPTKTDKAVYDAINNCDIDVTKYPYVYRWRHTVGLYSQQERESWPVEDFELSDDLDSPITCSFNIGHISHFESSTPTRKKNIYTITMDERNCSPNYRNSSVINPITLLTPKTSDVSSIKNQSWMEFTPNMQVSKWMRVTGPNSPRSALINRAYGPNTPLF